MDDGSRVSVCACEILIRVFLPHDFCHQMYSFNNTFRITSTLHIIILDTKHYFIFLPVLKATMMTIRACHAHFSFYSEFVFKKSFIY